MAARRRVVVIGAGSAGCAVAERIARSGRDDVLVVEDGGAPPPIAVGLLPLTDPERVRVHADREGTPLPRGRGLGGSSGVNGGYFLRAHRDDLRDWDTTVWSPETVDRVHTDLDGGDAGGGVMSVVRVSDEALGPRATAFEAAMRRAGHETVAGVWPRPGIIRARLNVVDGRRRTAADALLAGAVARGTVRVRLDTRVDHVTIVGGTVRSVVVGDGTSIPADVVVLAAGTVGSAVVAARSGLGSTMPLAEHRELLVRSRPAGTHPTSVGPVLPTMVHTDDGFEIRCYENDFADHVPGVPRTGPAIGIAAMRAVGRGSVHVGADGVPDIVLGVPDDTALRRMRDLAGQVATMLEGPGFAGVVEPGSTTIDAQPATSHHAWGALPLGATADWEGRVVGVDGLWVADAAALPTPLSSGPHATVMMLATVIGERIAAAV